LKTAAAVLLLAAAAADGQTSELLQFKGGLIYLPMS